MSKPQIGRFRLAERVDPADREPARLANLGGGATRPIGSHHAGRSGSRGCLPLPRLFDVRMNGHLGRVERRVMSAIDLCRTAELGGHIEAYSDCGLVRCAYDTCRNRHCPK